MLVIGALTCVNLLVSLVVLLLVFRTRNDTIEIVSQMQNQNSQFDQEPDHSKYLMHRLSEIQTTRFSNLTKRRDLT